MKYIKNIMLCLSFVAIVAAPGDVSEDHREGGLGLTPEELDEYRKEGERADASLARAARRLQFDLKILSLREFRRQNHEEAMEGLRQLEQELHDPEELEIVRSEQKRFENLRPIPKRTPDMRSRITRFILELINYIDEIVQMDSLRNSLAGFTAGGIMVRHCDTVYDIATHTAALFAYAYLCNEEDRNRAMFNTAVGFLPGACIEVSVQSGYTTPGVVSVVVFLGILLAVNPQLMR